MAMQVSTREIQLSDHVTSILETGGAGFPLVLIHAAAMDKSFWNHGIMQKIAGSQDNQNQQRRVITYDLRGHGKAANAPLTISTEQLADDLKQLCNALHLTKIDIGGISYGGVVAQKFSIDYPEMTRSALFIGTLSKGVVAFKDRAAMAETSGMKALYEPSLTRWFLPQSLEANNAQVRYVRKQFEITQVANWAAVWRALSKFDFSDRLKEVDVPTLCLASKEDTSTPPDFLKTICGLVKNGMYVEVEGGMHFFPLEVPEKTGEAMVSFLNRVDRER